jgi:hypothetical protein
LFAPLHQSILWRIKSKYMHPFLPTWDDGGGKVVAQDNGNESEEHDSDDVRHLLSCI